MAGERRPERHDLVWLAAGWRAALRGTVPPDHLAAAEDWFARGRPAVVRRAEAGGEVAVAIGIPLPPALGKARIGLRVERGALARIGPPLRLGRAIGSAPVPWRAPLGALDRAARAAGLALGVYGSLAWQHLTGEPYVGDGSDVDLLALPRSAEELRSLLDLLRAWEERTGLRADGEVLLAGGRAVAWREILSGRRRLLVKSVAAVALEPAAEALGGLVSGVPA